ncbi:MAG: hypothetical protein ACREPN_11690 [Rudaea sp.]
MLAETQREAMLAAMGIEIYRLRSAATATLRIFLDARACVQVACTPHVREDAAVARLFTLLPVALSVADACVQWCDEDAPCSGGIDIDAAAVHGNGMAKRALWQALKPLSQRLRHSA